jgi:hypothetical protein
LLIKLADLTKTILQRYVEWSIKHDFLSDSHSPLTGAIQINLSWLLQDIRQS